MFTHRTQEALSIAAQEIRQAKNEAEHTHRDAQTVEELTDVTRKLTAIAAGWDVENPENRAGLECWLNDKIASAGAEVSVAQAQLHGPLASLLAARVPELARLAAFEEVLAEITRSDS